MDVAVLFSGGKDSTLAMHLAEAYGFNIKVLLNVVPSSAESYMFHYPNASIAEIYEQALGIKVEQVSVDAVKEQELEALDYLFDLAKNKYGCKGVVIGAVRSVYQAERVQKYAYKHGLEVFNPLWQKSSQEIFDLLQRYDVDAYIVGIAGYPLSCDFLGKSIMELKDVLLSYEERYGLSAIGEGGELETFAYKGKMFKKYIRIDAYDIDCKNHEGSLIIRSVSLE